LRDSFVATCVAAEIDHPQFKINRGRRFAECAYVDRSEHSSGRLANQITRHLVPTSRLVPAKTAARKTGIAYITLRDLGEQRQLPIPTPNSQGGDLGNWKLGVAS